MRVFTIGFTKKSAEDFFETLSRAGVKRVIDVRVNNVSQLAGFSKKDDLRYFLNKICNIEYLHLPESAPTQEMLAAYRKKNLDWQQYEQAYLRLIEERQVERTVPKELVKDGCFLCSEDEPQRCHRRLVAEYFKEHWGDLEIIHLT